MEEEISNNIGAVMTEVGPHDLTNTDSDSYLVYQTYDIGAMKRWMIGSVNVALTTTRNAYEKKAMVKDVP